jgi:ABC-2 type transport system permease protein
MQECIVGDNLGVFMGVIFVMWKRQVTKYFRSKSRIVGSLGMPVLFLIALGFGFGSIYAKAGGGNYLEFLAPGIIAMTILFTATFSGIEIIWDRQFGFLKETLVAPVSRIKIMLGRTLGGATIAVFQGIIVLVISLLAGVQLTNLFLIPIALLFMFLTGLVFTSIGTAIASKLEDMQGFQLIINFIIMPLFFLSNALFPLDEMPAFLKVIAGFNPLSYGVDGLRFALTGTNQFNPILDFVVMFIVAVIFLIIGSKLFSKIEA